MHLLKFIFFFYSVMGLENPNDTLLQLRRDLFEKYDKLHAPSEGQLKKISIKLHILHIYKINEAAGVLSVNGFFQANWIDKRLSWQPRNYKNLSYLFVPQDAIWIPIIHLFNDAEMKNRNKYGNTSTTALLYNDGRIFFAVPTTFHSTCEIDHKYYPFDKHTCVMVYGKWRSGPNLNFQMLEFTFEDEILDDYALENPEWKISHRADKIIIRTSKLAPNLHYEFYDVEIGIERQAQFFTYVLITPIVLCVFITLSIFWIHIKQHGHLKIVIAGLLILVLFTLLSFLSWKIPPGGKSTPLIVLYCGTSLIMATVSIVATIATLRISRFSRKPIPYIVQNATKILLANFKKHELHALGDNQFENETSNRENNGWMLVNMAFDRLCFFIYVCVFVYISYSFFKV